MKSAVIVYPGSNCDRDLAVAIRDVTGHAPAMVWHRDTDLPEAPRSLFRRFFYGYYLRSGAMAEGPDHARGNEGLAGVPAGYL